MSRSVKKGRAGSTKTAKWKGFVQISLPEGTKPDTLWDLFDESEIVEVIDRLVCDGYKVSVSRDFDTGAFICSVTGQKEFCQNAGFTTSTFASSIDGGLLGCCWKVYYYNKGAGWDRSTDRKDYEL